MVMVVVMRKVMCKVMSMTTIVVLFPVLADMHLSALDAAAGAGGDLQLKFRTQVKFVQLGLQVVRVDSQINHGRHVHVAADAGKAVIIEYVHDIPQKGQQRSLALPALFLC